jgi:hypothetical protein
MNTVCFNREDLNSILDFFNKYPAAGLVTIQADGSSGIGQHVTASVEAEIWGDMVTVTKTIVDETNW